MKYFFSILLLCLVAITGYAHKINGYKYIIIPQNGNPYGIDGNYRFNEKTFY